MKAGESVDIDSLSFSYDTGEGEFVVNKKGDINVEYHKNGDIEPVDSLKYWHDNRILETSN